MEYVFARTPYIEFTHFFKWRTNSTPPPPQKQVFFYLLNKKYQKGEVFADQSVKENESVKMSNAKTSGVILSLSPNDAWNGSWRPCFSFSKGYVL